MATITTSMFRFVATANTNGAGDDTGLYQGTQRQNLAWLDRFTICEVGYPTADVEKSLLARRFPSLPEALCATMVEYANEIRKLFMGEASTGNLTNTIEVTFSTRSLLRWGDLTVRFQPLAHQGIQPVTYALDRALAYRASRETRAMPKRKTCRKIWGSFFQRHLLFVSQSRPLRASRWLLKGFDSQGHYRKSRNCKPFRPALPCAHVFRGFCRLGHKNGVALAGAGPYTPVRSIGCRRVIRVFSAGRQNKPASTLLCIFCWTSVAV